MTVSQVLGALGEWNLELDLGLPEDVQAQLDYFGHVAVVRGDVDVAVTGDALLSAARYVGVLRRRKVTESRTLGGSGMVFWLGDEDGKGHVIETAVNLTSVTLAAAVAAVLPPTVTVGTVFPLGNPAARYTGRHIYQSPREALQIICDAFGVEYRVNGNATVDVGTPAQLYNTTAPDSIIVRKAVGSDVDLTAIGGTYDADAAVFDYSTRILLLGQTVGDGTTPEETFVTGAADAPVVTYKDLRGNPVKLTRIISESGQTEGSVAARAQLQLNRFNRVTSALAVTAEQYDADGAFEVGDATYVFDPDSGIVDNAREVTFRGEVLHPSVIRITAATWPITRGHTVAFRTDDGAWIDLTPWVRWEGADSGSDTVGTSGATEITVGDLPRSLTSSSGNVVQDRVDAAQPNTGDASIPKAPTGLSLSTTAALDTWGRQIAYIRPSWAAVTQNTDDTAITDLSHYEARYRPQFRTPGWSGSEVTEDLFVDFVAANGLIYDVEVRAVDKAGNASEWSGTASIMAATDQGAPPAPADPQVSSYLGQLRIYYPGTDSLGNQMPADALSVGVYVGSTASFTISDDLRIDDLNPFAPGVSFATAPYFADRWVRFAAVDAAGNMGPSSAAVLGSTFKVVGDDIFIDAVGTAQLANLTVTTAKINELDLNNGRIGTLSVGKLTAGIMSADVTISGRFTTALTGARVEHNALGFQGFRTDGSKWLSLTPTESLLTGTLMTAASGRRIEIGAGGNVGEVRFIAPDNVSSTLRSYTDGSQGREGLQLGVTVAGAVPTWNSLFYNQQEWASYHTKIHDFVFQDRWSVIQTANQGVSLGTYRMNIDPNGWSLRAGVSTDPSRFAFYDFLTGHMSFVYGGNGRMVVQANLGNNDSPSLLLAAPDGFGAVLRASTSGGVFFDVRNVFDSGFLGVRAGAYVENSDARGKTAITDAPVTDASALIDTIKSKTFRRKGAKSRRVVDESGATVDVIEDGDEEVGVIAQEMPAFVVSGDEGDEMGVSHGRWLLLLSLSQQQILARLTALEAQGKGTP